MSRREFSQSVAVGAMLSTRAEKSATYAVVGAGVFGAWTAYTLLLSGHKVILIDQYGPASSRASSGGESRIIRCSYGPDELYTRMAWRSLSLWSEFFGEANRDLLHRTGVLWMARPGNQYAEQSRQSLRKAGVPFRDLSTEELARDYPQIQIDRGSVAILEPDSGALMARQAVHAVVEAFVARGGTYRLAAVRSPRGAGRLPGIEASGERITADAFVFACGPWLGKVFPDLLGPRIFVTRQEVLFFGIPAGDRRWEAPQMPVWIDFEDNRGMYGFPDLENRGFKVAFDNHGPPIDPDNANRFVTQEKINAARAYVAQRFPAMRDAPIVDSRVCQYENTSNGDFLIDRHPDFENVWLVGGGSGHGFKHGPAVGGYVAALLNGGATAAVEPRFSLASKGTEQNRSVV
ncbi:MAG: FAD-dependent oxidoreductase [Acidobacteriaceae bacterium]|nr:FAD-dependent oxidoreductase [Acidobacteriaceae bacterium]